MPLPIDTAAPTIFSALVQFYTAKLGATPGVDLFGGNAVNLPNENKPMLTIIGYGGIKPEGLHTEGLIVIRRPRFQLTARSIVFDEALALAEAAYAASQAIDEEIGGFFFLRISPLTEPVSLPLDPSGRARITFNLETVVRAVTALTEETK
jgi:hypothetical protein